MLPTRQAPISTFDLETPTSIPLTPSGRRQQPAQYLFKLLLQQLELAGLVLHRRELLSNQCQEPRTQARTSLFEGHDECLDLAEWHPQGARPPDEAQPLYPRLVVLPIPGWRAARGRQHADLLVVANRLRRHASGLGELPDGERGSSAHLQWFAYASTIVLPATGRSRRILGAWPAPRALTTAGPPSDPKMPDGWATSCLDRPPGLRT
jgi:hypothetical protein